MMIGVGRLLPLALGLATPLVTVVAGVVEPANRSTNRSGLDVVDLVIAASGTKHNE